MSKKDYYQILGINKTADEKEIKKTYKRLAMKYHPDRNQGNKEAETKFKEIKEAYEILIDTQKRNAYDQYGHAAFEQNSSMGNEYSNSFTSSADFSDIFGDVFGDIFGNNKKRHESTRGANLQYEIKLTLEEAVRGIKKEIRILTLKKCDICNGSGAISGTKLENCLTCNGIGQVQIRQGFFAVQQTCPTCHGRGQIIKKPCIKCHGKGRSKKYKTLSVKIPSGVNTGDRIRINGEGEAGENGALSGDLYVQINIIKHNIFERDGNNLYCEVPVNFSIAALGGDIDIPTLNGRISIKIPAETQTGKIFRMKEKGVKPIRGGIAGDLMCRILVETPVKLNEKQKNLLKEFGKSLNYENNNKNSPRAKNFLDNIKKFFDDLTK